MAGLSLLALLDDVVSALDDVAVMSKLAAKKTAGVLGDDLALTAQRVFGLRARRELPVVAKVAKGSVTAGRLKVGQIDQAQLEEIAKIKMEDLNTSDIEAAKNIIAGTARSMGLEVVG